MATTGSPSARESCFPLFIPSSRVRTHFVELISPVQRMSLASYTLPLSAGSGLWMCVFNQLSRVLPCGK